MNRWFRGCWEKPKVWKVLHVDSVVDGVGVVEAVLLLVSAEPSSLSPEPTK
jgi:hypothetical protein